MDIGPLGEKGGLGQLVRQDEMTKEAVIGVFESLMDKLRWEVDELERKNRMLRILVVCDSLIVMIVLILLAVQIWRLE